MTDLAVMAPIVSLVRVMIRKRAKFGFWVKLGGLLTFWFVAEALTLEALVTLVVFVQALGITIYFALAFSLSDRYHSPPLSILIRAPASRTRALYRTLEYS